MRHNKKFNHLSRTASHRAAMLANMASSLIKHKRITTTLAKAKALRQYVEPLITKSKNDTTHSRRVVFSYLKDKEAVKELFKEVSVKIADRPGGYTRIIKLGARQDDGTAMSFIELVDFDENMAKAAPKKTRRTRRGGRRTAAAKEQVDETQAETAEVVEETSKAEAPEAAAPAEEAPKAETPEVAEPAAEEPKAE